MARGNLAAGAAGCALGVLLVAGWPTLGARLGGAAPAAIDQDSIEQAVRSYLAANPALIEAAVRDHLKGRGPAAEREPTPAAQAELVRANAARLFASPGDVVLGNPRGDTTLVEFLDYNCGFCRRAFASTQELIKADPELRVVLKILPILGPASADVARVATAALLQDRDAARFLAFHARLMTSTAPADYASAIAAAGQAGYDIARIESDSTGGDVRMRIAETVELARALRLTGTPSYVLGERILSGAAPTAMMQGQIREVRAARPGAPGAAVRGNQPTLP